MIAAIVLAAGSSQRMGRPKALLRLRGATFLETVVVACEAAGLNRRVVVLGPDADKILPNIDLHGSHVVRNTQPSTGPIGSIRLALETIVNHPVDGVLVWHVDRPHIALATVNQLLDRFRDSDAAIVLPEFEGKRGHPVLFRRTVFSELVEAPDGKGARGVVRADPSRVSVVPVPDPAVLEDIDTPEAYRDVLRRIEAAGATPPGPPQL
jgi:molybdenum cofactor cytidylyltransferase